MSELWRAVFNWASALGAGTSGANVAASVTSVLALVTAAWMFCCILVRVSRRVMATLSWSEACKEKAALFVRSASRFLFAWILSSYIYDAMGVFQLLAAPVSRISSVIAILLCAAMLARAVTCMRTVAKECDWGNALESKTFSQMLKIFIWFIAFIVAVSVMMGKSPAFVLSGLGALTAVLMLIFRDSLLGLVAGIQVSQNDMVRVGDWITMPKYNADGNVIDIALTTVKVRNFDNTVTMIPSSALISDAFINWRYMSTSKGRRIKRPVWISVTSVRELTEERRKSLIAAGLLSDEDRPVSNLAAFETWLRRMLGADENLTTELTCMVRQTEAGDTGIPVEVYAFTKTRDWVEYEMIQTEIFDRIFVTVPKFGLQIYQRTGDKGMGA